MQFDDRDVFSSIAREIVEKVQEAYDREPFDERLARVKPELAAWIAQLTVKAGSGVVVLTRGDWIRLLRMLIELSLLSADAVFAAGARAEGLQVIDLRATATPTGQTQPH
jgi:hypothetical protein